MMKGYPKFNPMTWGEVYFVFWAFMAAGAAVMIWKLVERFVS